MAEMAEMEAMLCKIVDLSIQYRELIKLRFGKTGISKIKQIIRKHTNYDQEVLNSYNALEASVLYALDELDAVLNPDNIKLLKTTKVLKSIKHKKNKVLYYDLLDCCIEAPFNSRDRHLVKNEERDKIHSCYLTGEKYNVVQLIHKDFPSFLLYGMGCGGEAFRVMSHAEDKINTIRFFYDNNLLDKDDLCIYFSSTIHKYTRIYTSALFIWNNYLINLMESAEEALYRIKDAISIASTGESFEIYKQLIYSVKAKYHSFDVDLLLTKPDKNFLLTNPDIQTSNLKYGLTAIKNIILAGKFENLKFLFEFENFEIRYNLLILQIIFNDILDYSKTGKNLLDGADPFIKIDSDYFDKTDLTYDRAGCIKLIIKLISIMKFPQPVECKSIILFVSKAEHPEYFDLIDELVYKGLCSLEDTSQVFKDTYISKRNVETFLCGLNRLVNAGTVPYVDVEVFRGFLKV
jgi:hypothetical protein